MNRADLHAPVEGAQNEVLVRLEGIGKVFPGVVANDDISLEVRRGQVHCLLGENGAGKSTLISILAGMQQPDSGHIEINGARVAISSPRVAMDHGIGVVYQHTTLIPTLTVLENLMLGDTGRLPLDRKGAMKRLKDVSAKLGADINPNALAGDLGLGQQQQVEIAKAMWQGSKVLILDEPTSMLTPQAIAELEESVNRLKAEGLAVIFITHKLREAYAIGDCVTVLRGGRMAAYISPEELSQYDEEAAKKRILEAMFGDDIDNVSADQAEELAGATRAGQDHDADAAASRPLVLELRGVSSHAGRMEIGIDDVSIAVHAGEVLGIAGIDGHGQSALAETIAGQRSAQKGAVLFEGREVTKLGVRARQRLGLRYVTDDRLHEGIVGDLSVAVNLVLKRIGQAPFWKRGQINRSAVQAEAAERIAEYEIRTPGADTRAGTLSGGNIQKILLARELSHDPKVVVFHKPTYGLDLKTVHRVREAVRRFAAEGGAALLISTDLDELVELSDRIAVISKGRIVGEVANDSSGTSERVGELMTGSTREPSLA
ncbi:putative B6 ABC transporter ATP-binding protein [Ruicaihuangia caeni]|uniref:putative B6 ABC transporter ATP-binding protein n=1 Tax=Ruicaihuangia caeni TaxID=3042517 RepID=UPI00338F19F9